MLGLYLLAMVFCIMHMLGVMFSFSIGRKNVSTWSLKVRACSNSHGELNVDVENELTPHLRGGENSNVCLL